MRDWKACRLPYKELLGGNLPLTSLAHLGGCKEVTSHHSLGSDEV